MCADTKEVNSRKIVLTSYLDKQVVQISQRSYCKKDLFGCIKTCKFS